MMECDKANHCLYDRMSYLVTIILKQIGHYLRNTQNMDENIQ
jgi:hypothetical protein